MVYFLDYLLEQDQIYRAARFLQTAESLYAIDIMTNLQQLVLLLFAIKLSFTASRTLNQFI